MKNSGPKMGEEPRPVPPFLLGTDSWDLAYAGFGAVEFQAPQTIVLSSRRTNSPQLTHGALVLSKRDFPPGGYEVEVEYKLEAQLRSPAPNPWETFWLFTSYQPWPSGKATNYVMVKPNGFEAGKAWSHEEQSFATTLEKPVLLPGQSAKLRVKVMPYGAMHVFFQGRFVAEVPADKLYTHGGKLGLYVEDARVTVKAVRVRWLTN
ncbi:MAG: hypothetical protein EOP11_17315 [Proteobacteria bacterium]|nr:MAG: hypothetical protein EOP11_17315 [Pseudomonadota bacterium]